MRLSPGLACDLQCRLFARSKRSFHCCFCAGNVIMRDNKIIPGVCSAGKGGGVFGKH